MDLSFNMSLQPSNIDKTEYIKASKDDKMRTNECEEKNLSTWFISKLKQKQNHMKTPDLTLLIKFVRLSGAKTQHKNKM